MNEPGIAEWRNEAARQRFIDMEDEFWRERWPDPPTALDVDSYAGTTRVYRWPGAGEPIVFLHGMGGTGLTWSAYVERLIGRDLYAIDTIGDVGRSQQRAVIEDTAGLARWLAETLTGAGIERGHLVGTSYGGFLALGLAVLAPVRVASLLPIDSGGLAPFRLGRFMLWGLPMLFGSVAPRPARRLLARRRPMLGDPRIMRWHCTPRGITGSSSRERPRSQTTNSAPSRPHNRDRGSQERTLRGTSPGHEGPPDPEREGRGHPQRSPRRVLDSRRPLRRPHRPGQAIARTRRPSDGQTRLGPVAIGRAFHVINRRNLP